MFRAYIKGITLDHVPDMTVIHHHGRKTWQAGYALWRSYMTGQGAINTKYFFKHPRSLSILLLGHEKCFERDNDGNQYVSSLRQILS